MAFKLSKKEQAEFEELLLAAGVRVAEMTTAVEQFNTAFAELQTDVKEAQEKLNEALSEVRTKIEEWVSGWQDELADKSERFQESARGEKVQAWIDEWEEFGSSIDDVDVDIPEEIDVELPDLEEDGPQPEPED